MKDKVTLEDVHAAIKSIEFVRMGHKTTVGLAVLHNGFEIVESSSCVNPNNYSAEIGEKLCRQRIEDRIWAFLGFQLQTELAGLRLALEEGTEVAKVVGEYMGIPVTVEAANG